jgi:hypothetical protein
MIRLSLLLSAVAAVSCGPNETILKSNSNESTAPPGSTIANSQAAYDSVEGEVENMRTADFDFILVLRRKDGGVMQSDDKAFVRTYTTPNANRRSLVDGGKAIVIGANAGALGGVVRKLSERFDVANFSKPNAEINNLNKAVNANIAH